MKALRNLVFVCMAMVFAAVALPANAADKLFLLSAKVFTTSGSPIGTVIPAGTTSVLLLDYANQSPNGANSVIKSIDAYIPADVQFALIRTNSVNVTPSTPTVACPAPPTYSGAAPTQSGSGLASPALNINGITGVKPQGHFCVYLAVATTATSCTAETWRGDANTGNSISGGQPFFDFNLQTQAFSLTSTTDGCTGVLGCDSTNNRGGTLNPTLDTAYIGTPGFGLFRGNNANGTACTVVPYQFNFDPVNNAASFIVSSSDKGAQQLAVEYVLLWSPVTVDPYPSSYDPSALTAGWTDKRPKLAWGFTAANPPPPGAYVPALACVSDNLQGNANPVSLLPIIPNTEPFASLASTYPQYTPGTQAQMCVAQHAFTSVGTDGSGNTLVQYWDKVIDESDGWVTIN